MCVALFSSFISFREGSGDVSQPTRSHPAARSCRTRLASGFIVARDRTSPVGGLSESSSPTRHHDPLSFTDFRLHIPSVEITTFRVDPQTPAAGKSLEDLHLRRNFEVTLLAIQRGSGVVPNPGRDTTLMPGDTVILLGAPDKMCAAATLFRRGESPGCEDT